MVNVEPAAMLLRAGAGLRGRLYCEKKFANWQSATCVATGARILLGLRLWRDGVPAGHSLLAPGLDPEFYVHVPHGED